MVNYLDKLTVAWPMRETVCSGLHGMRYIGRSVESDLVESSFYEQVKAEGQKHFNLSSVSVDEHAASLFDSGAQT